GKTSFTADAQSFFYCPGLSLALAAHVRSVNAAVFRSNLGKLNQLVGCCIMSGWIDERSGNTYRTVSHGLIHESFHFIHLGRRWSTIDISQYGFANLTGANVRANIQRSTTLF